jgi:hypothetical protein
MAPLPDLTVLQGFLVLQNNIIFSQRSNLINNTSAHIIDEGLQAQIWDIYKSLKLLVISFSVEINL